MHLLFRICWSQGCYCKPGFVFDWLVNECVDEEECGRHSIDIEMNEDYLRKLLIVNESTEIDAQTEKLPIIRYILENFF